MRIKELGVRAFAEPWPETRRNLLYAGGLKDAPQTRLAFSDANHCDLTRMAARAARSAARASRSDRSIIAVPGCAPPSTRSSSQADVDAEARRRAKEAKRERNRRIREEKERRARKKAAKEAKRAAAAAAAS